MHNSINSIISVCFLTSLLGISSISSAESLNTITLFWDFGDTIFYEGDDFYAKLVCQTTQVGVNIDLYAVIEVAGIYYYLPCGRTWPCCTQTTSRDGFYEVISLGNMGSIQDSTQVVFYAAAFDRHSGTLLSNIPSASVYLEPEVNTFLSIGEGQLQDWSYGKVVREQENGDFIIGVTYTSYINNWRNAIHVVYDHLGIYSYISKYEVPVAKTSFVDIDLCSDGGSILLIDFHISTALTHCADGILVVKISARGFEEWRQIISDQNCLYSAAVRQADDGGFVVLGNESCSALGEKSNVYKFDSVGNLLWSKSFYADKKCKGHAMTKTTAGAFVLAFEINQPFSSNLTRLLKLDANGQTIWSKAYSCGFDERPCSVIQCPDGGFLVGANLYRIAYQQPMLRKVDSSGNEVWMKFYGNNYFQDFQRVQSVWPVGYIAVGTSKHHALGEDFVWLVKVNALGEISWEKELDVSDYDDRGFDIYQCKDHGFIITGHILTKYMLLKTDAKGRY